MKCRACASGALSSVIDLGPMPLVNALCRTSEEAKAAPRHPLEVFFCEVCALVQIGHDVPSETLFREYTYFSSYSDTMLKHAEAMASDVIARRALGASSFVVELASNDGYLLQFYARRGIPVLGIEPARNVAEVARNERNIPTISEFFDETLAAALAETPADVIHASNVLAHVPDPGSFLRGIARLLKDTGVAVLEVPHVVHLVDRCELDTIYHEHFCYFSFTALTALLAESGLEAVSVASVAIHGGSLRITAAKKGAAAPDASVGAMLEEERSWGVRRLDTYLAFAARADKLRAGLRALVRAEGSAGKRWAAYGASAKGCVLMNYAGLDAADIGFVVDKSPHKQGRFVPGVGAAIEAPERLVEAMPDLVLLTVWNLEREVLAQQQEYRSRGGAFVVPIPEIRVLP